jgi:class 3 adenylate cyclase/CHASE2 domain-containing sensor protein
MTRIDLSGALAAVVIALFTSLSTMLPAMDVLRGLSVDALTGLSWHLLGPTRQTASPVVVVALDEETYRTPPFAGSPNITWTGEIGRVLTAIVEAGAQVVGFDIVFSTSVEQSEIPFGDETLGARVRGFDRGYLRALALAAQNAKIVLGQVQLRDQPILPSPGQRIAVGQQRNIRGLNVYTDPDDVVRRLPLSFVVDNETVPSMAVELAARALQSRPDLGPDGRWTIGGYRVPSPRPNTMTVNFAGGPDYIPTFSLADLRACVEKADREFFRREFDNKVVLFGALLDVEDLKITSKRWMTEVDSAGAARCALPRPEAKPAIAHNWTSGVYIHATGVRNLLERSALDELGPVPGAGISFALSALLATAALAFTPINAGTTLVLAALAWTGVAIAAFRYALVLPLIEPILAGLVAVVVTIGYRFVISDKDKLLLRKSFALYLEPSVVDRLISSHKLPELGGETRNITVYFSDLAGFSALSEKLSPTEVVAMMNEYFSAMSDIIEAHGGFIDKYIGDAIVAVFGAPFIDPDHARNAVRAALRCQQRMRELSHSGITLSGYRLQQRIGLNSGEALVGNIGSRRRFNYTVMGDAVNLASRLEGANKYFGTLTIASESTVALTGTTFVWRELDSVHVLGRSGTVTIYEPLAESGGETAQQSAQAAAYASGLACWRDGDFAAAAEWFGRFADSDAPAACFKERASGLAAHPPGPDWVPVSTLEGK